MRIKAAVIRTPTSERPYVDSKPVLIEELELSRTRSR